MRYTWDFSIIWKYKGVLLKGAIITLELTGLSVVLGTFFGILLGLMLRTKIRIIRYPLLFLTDAVRSEPVLILILWFYYFLPVVVGGTNVDSFTVAMIALSVNLSAFVADVVRGAIDGVPRGYVDAARALGMSKITTTFRVVLPEAIRQIIPSLSLLYIAILKLSSLASVIAVYELLHSADAIITSTFKSLEVYTVVAIIYLILVMPSSYFMRRLEQASFFKRRA